VPSARCSEKVTAGKHAVSTLTTSLKDLDYISITDRSESALRKNNDSLRAGAPYAEPHYAELEQVWVPASHTLYVKGSWAGGAGRIIIVAVVRYRRDHTPIAVDVDMLEVAPLQVRRDVLSPNLFTPAAKRDRSSRRCRRRSWCALVTAARIFQYHACSSTEYPNNVLDGVDYILAAVTTPHQLRRYTLRLDLSRLAAGVKRFGG